MNNNKVHHEKFFIYPFDGIPPGEPSFLRFEAGGDDLPVTRLSLKAAALYVFTDSSGLEEKKITIDP